MKDADNNSQYKLWYSVLAAANASLGITFFTYNLTIFNAVMPFLRKYILVSQSDFVVVLVASAPLCTAALGALVAGNLSMIVGRRKLMMASDLLAIAGVILTLFQHLSTFLVGRFLIGFPIGITTVAAPLYFTELTPLSYRGEITNAPTIFGAIGILLATLLGLIVPSALGQAETDGAWRVLLALAMLAPIIRLTNFVLLFRYDTPYYYVSKNKYNKAAYILKKIYKGNIAERIDELVHERDYIQKRNGKIRRWRLFGQRFRKALLVCMLIESLQYLSGLNLILVYTGGVYGMGATGNYSWLPQLLGVTTAMVNFFTSIFSIWTTSQFGRKPLLVGGTFFAGLFLALYGILAEAISPDNLAPKIFLVLWPIPWGLSLGSVLYVIVAETLPDIGVSTANLFNWIFAFLSLQFFPESRDALGLGWTFIMFGGVTIIGSVLLLLFVVETRDKHKDEILKEYSHKYEPATESTDRQFPQRPPSLQAMSEKPQVPEMLPEGLDSQQGRPTPHYAPSEQILKEAAINQV